jgi:uncharacterized protein
MDFSGEYRIPAPPQQVWDALVDPEVLKACIVGCRELTRTSDTEFAAVVAAKVGPISATFRGTVALLDLDPPRAYTLSGQGQGGAAGFARMTARVTLAEDGPGTLLRYEAQADIGGKLATVGSRLVQSVAKRQADDFFAAFAQRLGGGAVAPETAAGEPGSGPQAAPDRGADAADAEPRPATASPAAPSSAAAPAMLPSWVIALVAGGCGVVLGFVLGRL